MTDEQWLDQFYTDLEKGFTKYTRPNNWKEKLDTLGKRKPVQNQYEGQKYTRKGEIDG